MKSVSCLSVAVLLALLAAAAQSADLLEVYERALQSDPLLREADANRLAALESKPQARAGLLPQLTLSASRTDAKQDGQSSRFAGGSFADTLSDDDENQAAFRLSLTQPLFRWDQWLGLKQSDKIVAQAEVDFELAQQDLIVRVAERYFAVLTARVDLEAQQANKEAIARQLEQAETRFEVGLIAITDVEESRAAYDQAVASEIQARRVLATARENLRELTGIYFEDLEAPDEALPLAAPAPADDDAWVSQAMEQNLALVSSRFGVEIAKDSIKVQRAGHLPTLDLIVRRDDFNASGDGTLEVPGFGPPGPSTTSNDFTTDTILLQFNLPIYSGGRTSSQAREAVYQHRAARERLERVARETERETRDAYFGVISDVSTVKALQQALSSSQTALRATEAGFDVGTRTSVDVLDARRNLFNARTNLARSRYDYIIDMLRLKRAAGSLSGSDLEEINGWLN